MVFIIIVSSINTLTVQASELIYPEDSEYIIVLDNENASGNGFLDAYEGCVVDKDENIYSCLLNPYEVTVVKRNESVIHVEDNIVFSASEDYNEDIVVEQWNLEATGVDEIEEHNQINIAILDSGVDYSSDFHIEENVDLVKDGNESALFRDSTGHGSAMASVIAASHNEYGIDGINPYAKIFSVRVLDSNNQSPLSRIIEGIYWCIDNNIHIINMSFGTNIDSDILHSAIIDAYNAGILIVAAAGNTNHMDVQYPAAYEEVVSVGSVNALGELSANTSVGKTLDVLAPGENIPVVDFIDTISTTNGTSIATAQVTGIASLLWAKDISKSNEFIKNLLCAAVNRPDNLTGTEAGIVNYSVAADVYDEFSENYNSTTFVEDYSRNIDFDYTETAEIIVDGLWSNPWYKEGHYTLSEDATEYAEFAGYAPEITRFACTNLDAYNTMGGKEGSDGKPLIVGAPHGAGNYMINLRFLYLASRCIYDNGVGTEYESLVESYKNNTSYWNVSWHSENKTYDKDRFDALVDQIEIFLDKKTIMAPTVKNNFAQCSVAAQNRYLGLMIFGMALHLTGDIYAHRTIVPKYTVAGTNGYYNSTNANGLDMFGVKYFDSIDGFVVDATTKTQVKQACFDDKINSSSIRNWQYFQLGVSCQVAEFRDINMFLQSSYQGDNNPFEDDASFCPERYDASLLACKRVAERFKSAGSFYTKLIYPKVYNGTATENEGFQYIKLNNFKNYTQVSGLAMIGVDLDESDWAINSTNVLV